MADNGEVITPCPCCKQELFKSVPVGPGTAAKSTFSPRLQSDERGHFMICAHCSKRIAFEPIGHAPTGALTFQISPKQECR